jgi:hypothetical protein
MSDLSLDLSALIERCRAALIDSAPTLISHSDLNNLRNNRLPESLITTPINVYALWSRKIGVEAWELQYIGQRTSKQGWRRVCEHLFHVYEGTESKLKRVRQALHEGQEIGVTGILVEPDSLRLTIEDELIAIITRTKGALPWNKKSRSKVRVNAP